MDENIVFVCENNLCRPLRRSQLFEGEPSYETAAACRSVCAEKKRDAYVVRIPKQDIEFDPTFLRNYLEGFCPDTLDQNAIRTILRATQIVSFEDFERALKVATFKALRNVPLVAKGWVVLPFHLFSILHNETPYAWTTKLALDLFPSLAKSRLLLPVPSRFVPRYYVLFIDILDNDPIVRILLDSAIPSITETFQGKRRSAEIVVISAYASDKAIATLLEETKLPKGIGLQIFTGKKLLPLSEIEELDDDNVRQYIEKKFGSVDKYPYLFSHRMLDADSSYPQVYSGYIPALTSKSQLEVCPRRAKPQIIPFIRGCLEEFKTSFLDLEQKGEKEGEKEGEQWRFLVPTIECPYPPYKRRPAPTQPLRIKKINDYGAIAI